MILTNIQLLLASSTSPLSWEEEISLFGQLPSAKDQIVKANLRLVVKVARKMKCPEVALDEFVSEGLLVLLQCIDTSKVDKGFRFSTYLQDSLYWYFSRFKQEWIKCNTGRVDSQMIFEDNDDIIDLMEALEVLEPLEKVIVEHYYGIGQESMTLKELNIHLGLSPQWVGEILARAIRKLKMILK